MNIKIQSIAAVVLAAALTSASVYAADPAAAAAPPAKKTTKHAPKPKPEPTATAAEVQELKQELETQIKSLKEELSTKDAQLKQAQDAAAAAQASAARAEAAASSQQQAVTENATAVTTLQSTVTDLKANQTNLVTTIQDNQAQVKKAIESPDSLHYKSITITPGGYMAAESVYRPHATGGDIPTAFSAIPYEHADAYALSEFYGSARQSRVAFLAEGKTNWGTLRGYVEADFLGTGTTSNNNQSNSYLLRQRVVWGQAALNNGWAFTGGQLWSLATEDKKGISNFSGDILTPQTIDPNYNAGFVWTRQYGFRVTYTGKHAAFGVAAEAPEILYSGTLAGDTPYAVMGSAGANGGNYNAATGSCSNSTYTTYSESDGVVTPTTKYLNICAPLASISFNQAPDLLLKAAFDPGWGHYEVFGIGRFAHETIYPGITNNAFLYGGVTDTNGVSVAPLTSAGSFNHSATLGGVGASFRAPIVPKKLDLGAKGLWGRGVGRYGDTTLSDLTDKPNGEFAALKNYSFLTTAEWTPTPRLLLYLNYGGDIVDHTNYTSTTITKATYSSSAETITYKIGSAPVGYGSPLSSNSSCLTNGNPTYTGVGVYPAGSCSAATRFVKEYTAGYWYDLYKGPAGRLRQGFQYSYADRQSVTDTSGNSTRGLENMFWTSFRYYLP
jgi:Spy/CpxP family protein refolding chaperone